MGVRRELVKPERGRANGESRAMLKPPGQRPQLLGPLSPLKGWQVSESALQRATGDPSATSADLIHDRTEVLTVSQHKEAGEDSLSPRDSTEEVCAINSSTWNVNTRAEANGFIAEVEERRIEAAAVQEGKHSMTKR